MHFKKSAGHKNHRTLYVMILVTLQWSFPVSTREQLTRRCTNSVNHLSIIARCHHHSGTWFCTNYHGTSTLPPCHDWHLPPLLPRTGRLARIVSWRPPPPTPALRSEGVGGTTCCQLFSRFFGQLHILATGEKSRPPKQNVKNVQKVLFCFTTFRYQHKI